LRFIRCDDSSLLAVHLVYSTHGDLISLDIHGARYFKNQLIKYVISKRMPHVCPLNGHKQFPFRVLYLLFTSHFKSTSFSIVTIRDTFWVKHSYFCCYLYSSWRHVSAFILGHIQDTRIYNIYSQLYILVTWKWPSLKGETCRQLE